MKIKMLTLSAFMLITAYVFAQIEVKLNPIGLLFGQIPVSGEYLINDDMGAEVTLGYYFKKESGLDDVSKSSGIVSNLLFKYYFNPEKGGDKFYAFPYFRYVSRSFTFTDASNDEIKSTYKGMGVGFGVGYKIVAESGLLFDFGFGVGKNFVSEYTYSDPSYSGSLSIPINILGRISIGYRFN